LWVGAALRGDALKLLVGFVGVAEPEPAFGGLEVVVIWPYQRSHRGDDTGLGRVESARKVGECSRGWCPLLRIDWVRVG